MAESMTNGVSAIDGDVEMKEGTVVEKDTTNPAAHTDLTDPQPAPIPSVQTQPERLSTIQPVAAVTPPATGGANARPGSMPPQPAARPEKPVAHGGPTRQYLNSNITPHLLEGMKYLAVYEPEKPLQWLADFLRDRSREVEG